MDDEEALASEKLALIAEAREWAVKALPPSPWADNHIVLRLANALEAKIAEAEEQSFQDMANARQTYGY